MSDFVGAFLFSAFFATLIVVLVSAYDDPPDWWRPER